MKRRTITGLPRGEHRLHQFFLPANQIKVRPIAHVIQVPGLARSLFVIANGQNDYVRLLRNFDGFLAIWLRSSTGSLAMTSSTFQRPADGDLAAFAVKDLRALADFGLYAFEHGDVVLLGTPL